jgi:small-conductance mechanosensitive channel
VLAPVDYSHIETALAGPPGWQELGLVALCFAIGWLVDRRTRWSPRTPTEAVRVGAGGVNRLIFPLVTLLLLLAARVAFKYFHPPFFLSLAIPLVVALALIRLFVYALRGIFGAPPWLKTSERAISFAIWGIVILHFLGVLPQIGDELEAIEIPIGKHGISLLAIGKGALLIVLTVTVSLWLSSLVEHRLLKSEGLDSNLRVVMAKTIRALLLVVAVLVALQAVGLDLTLLSVFGGALGVGIGLGLQKLASNYIAGFTILIDRSIRLGDMITVDGRNGVVTRVTSRYVVVRSLDGVEAIVPNETLVTTTVLNHSYTSRDVRLGVPVQVAYDSDLDHALQLLESAGAVHPRVMKSPNPPKAFVVRFAESGVELELGVWVLDPENGQLNLRSDLNQAIFRAFAEHGIRIPYPQRELRILDGASPASPPGATRTPAEGPAPAV